MSLIDEALKRAQGIESVDEAIRRGAAYPFMARNLQERLRSRRALLLGFLAGGVLASLVAGGIVFWLAARRAPAPAVRVDAARPAPSASAAPLPETIVSPPASIHPARPETSAPAVPQIARTRPVAAAAPGARPKPSASSPRAAAPAEPAPPASALGIVGGKAYPGEVALSDGRKLALDGIVYSETSPVAMINGRVLGVGGTVGEFAVAKIEADRVELRGQGIAFTLVLK